MGGMTGNIWFLRRSTYVSKTEFKKYCMCVCKHFTQLPYQDTPPPSIISNCSSSFMLLIFLTTQLGGLLWCSISVNFWSGNPVQSFFISWDITTFGCSSNSYNKLSLSFQWNGRKIPQTVELYVTLDLQHWTKFPPIILVGLKREWVPLIF